MSKCQSNACCVINCVTPEEIAARRCEYCFEQDRGNEALRLRTEAIAEAATELLSQLDALSCESEPSPVQRASMELLRDALAA